MTPPRSTGLRPWLGSAALHLALIAIVAAFALRWRSETPPLPQLALEGNVVHYQDLPPALRAGKPMREPQPAPTPAPKVEPTPTPPEPAVDTAAQRAAEVQKQREVEQAAAAEKRRQAEAAAEKQRQADALAEKRREAEAAAAKQREAEAAAAQKRKADALKREQEAATKQQQLAAQEAAREAKQQADRDAKAKAQREAELRRALANEEEGEAIQRSGVVDEYRALLTQTIERNWIRPPSAKPGLECTLYVTQVTGGTVKDVKLGECNGDQAVRESITNAVYRSSPLPAPRDPRAFESRLVLVFKPTE